MDDKLKKVGALAVAGLVGLGLGGAGVYTTMNDNFDDGVASVKCPTPEPVVVVGDVSYDLDAVEKLLKEVDELGNSADLSAADLAELQSKYDEKVAELKALEAYDDVLSKEMDKDAAFAEVGLLLDGEEVSEDYEDMLDDLKDDLKDKLNELGWDVEDVDDFVYVKLLDNDDADFDLDRNDDDELEGTLAVDVKVKFHEDGEDGDRHRETFRMEFEVEDGEVVDFDFLEE